MRLEDAGHRDEHVDRPAVRLDPVDEHADPLRVAEVEGDLGTGLAIDARDPRAGRAQARGDRPADPVGSARDERVASLEVSHRMCVLTRCAIACAPRVAGIVSARW